MTTTVRSVALRGAARDVLRRREKEVLICGAAGTGKSFACLQKVHLMCLQNGRCEPDCAREHEHRDGDLVIDPETGKHVRDYSLRLAAFKAARDSDAEIRKLYGLDSPTKIEQSGSVRYEVMGVNTELLS